MSLPTAPPAVSPQQPAWTDPLLANPHAVADKAARVNQMFSAIAPSYDLNNRLHSLWMDQHWRSVAVKMAKLGPDDKVLDVACGTGDLTIKFARALAALRYRQRDIRPDIGQITGLDFTPAMLDVARRKPQPESQRTTAAGLEALPAAPVISWITGDALQLPFAKSSFDVLSIAFGIRNVADWGRAIDEFARVLKPGGRVIILEFSLPTNRLLRALYNFYFRKILPRTATLIARDKSGAYKYLPESVNTFISREAMQARLQQAGFTDILAQPLTCGICVCYRGTLK